MALGGGLVRISGISLPDTQRFACSRRAVKELFGEDLDWVSFGASPYYPPGRVAPYSHRPRFTGIVVATMHLTRDQSKYLLIYPVPRAEYPEKAIGEFTTSVLPKFREWLMAMLARPETEILGHEELTAEWVDGGHRLHQVRFW
jgi:hypothetical protein